jgi:hypothetical protein
MGAECDTACGWPNDALAPVINRINHGYFVGKDFNREQHAEDSEHLRIFEPRPSGRQLDEINNSSGESQYQQRNIGVEPGGDGKTATGEHLKHYAFLSTRWG